MKTLRIALLSALAIVSGALAGAAEPPSAPVTFDIARQPLRQALQAFAAQTGLQVMLREEGTEADKHTARSVKGELTPQQALQQLLEATSLTYEFVTQRMVRISEDEVDGEDSSEKTAESEHGAEPSNTTPVGYANPGTGMGKQGESSTSAGSTATTAKKEDEEGPESSGIPEILVTGSKLGALNADIERTRDAMQPYVVFDREVIERSGATNVHEFLRNNLTMNVVADSPSLGGDLINKSSVNLRGLGTDETLILVDGRRAAPVAVGSEFGQPDLNGIPLSAIERIEVLPTTASAIYGGGATGGVINVVLRRDYSGVEGKVTYGGTFDGGGANSRVELSSGFTLGTRTNLMLVGSYRDADPLLIGERDLMQRWRRHVLASNPASIFGNVAPPIGATPNIHSNVVVGGVRQNLVLDDGTPLNSTITYVPVGYAGTNDGGAALLPNAGQYNLNLSETAGTFGVKGALVGASKEKSLMTTLRQSVSSRIEAFVEVQASENRSTFPQNIGWFSGGANIVALPATAPNNPFQQDIQVAVPAMGLDGVTMLDAESRRVVAGLIATLPANWRSTIDYTWNESRVSFESPPGLAGTSLVNMRNGSIDVLRDLNQFPVALETNAFPSDSNDPHRATLKSIALRLAGPLPWTLPAGNPTLTMLAESREEATKDATRTFGTLQFLMPARSQEVRSVYLESQIPLISSSNRLPGISRLELQLAARHDDYSVTGSTGLVFLFDPSPVERFTRDDSSTDPTIALLYHPTEDLAFRASFGTGYLSPSVSQLVPQPSLMSNVLTQLSITDPLRGNELVGQVALEQGGSPDLGPERSDSWSAGLILTPQWLPKLRLSVDWSKTKKTNNIAPLTISQEGLADLIAYFPERVTRDVPSDGFQVGRIIGVNQTLLNMAAMQVEALDVALDYSRETRRLGTLEFSLGATRLLTLEAQLTPSAPTVENVGVLAFADEAGGLKWKGNGIVRWAYKGWSLGWRMSYFDSYFLNTDHSVVPNQGSATVPEQIYHDLFGGYRFPGAASIGVLADAEIRFGISNIFNKEPPVDANRGFYSRLGDPRLANYYVSIRKAFGH